MVAKPLAEIVTELETGFPDGPPSDHQIRSQGFRFYRKHWSDRWPSNLPAPATLHDSQPTGHLTRADVFARARDVTSAKDAIELYVLMCS